MAASGKTPLWQVVLLFIPILFGVLCLVIFVAGIVKVITDPSRTDPPPVAAPRR
jgi:hypothetical protein